MLRGRPAGFCLRPRLRQGYCGPTGGQIGCCGQVVAPPHPARRARNPPVGLFIRPALSALRRERDRLGPPTRNSFLTCGQGQPDAERPTGYLEQQDEAS